MHEITDPQMEKVDWQWFQAYFWRWDKIKNTFWDLAIFDKIKGSVKE